MSTPSIIQACMICLDTESKMCMMSKYNLENAYENLTGHSIHNEQINLTQALCTECTQRLINFSRFREKSLRARSLMEDLIEKYKVITVQHVKLIDREINQLNSNIVKVILKSYGYDSGDNTENNSKETVDNVVKNEQNFTNILVEPKLEINDNDYTDVSNENNLLDSTLELETRLINEELSKMLSRKALMFVEQFSKTNVKQNIKCEPTFKCTICSDMFLDEDAYSEHIGRHMVKRENEIKSEITEEPNEVNASNTILHETNCLNCDVNIKTEKTLKVCETQITTHSEKKQFTCDDCESTFKHKNILIKHIKTHTGVKLYSCKLCDKKFIQKSKMNKHMKSHSNEKLFKCKFCEYECELKNNLVLHMKMHSCERPFACKLCPSKFKMSGHLTRHMKSHSGEKPYACNICGYKFTQKSSLNKHMSTHTREKRFKCDLCEYKSSDNNDLTIHKRVHTGEKPYSCKFCKHTSRTRYSMTTHTRIHTGEKPYSCKVCHYKCVRSSQLVRHMRTHTGEKRFSCTLCPFKCTRHCNLEMHMRMHTGDFYTCDYCQYKSAHRGYFIAHIRTHLNQIQNA